MLYVDAIRILEKIAQARFLHATMPKQEEIEEAIKVVASQVTVQACPGFALHAALWWIEMSKKYNVDFRVYGYEMGLEFNREIEIVEGRLVTNRRIKFKDYKWECPDPTLGG